MAGVDNLQFNSNITAARQSFCLICSLAKLKFDLAEPLP
jgi:hypothetical protein